METVLIITSIVTALATFSSAIILAITAKYARAEEYRRSNHYFLQKAFLLCGL
jgi:multisubunit Na+/H+ antiporter MnhC subunit